MLKLLKRFRVSGITFQGFGVQFASAYPPPDTSFKRAQDERLLMDKIWMMATTEAYVARQAQKLSGSRDHVIDTFYSEQPELKRFVDRNIEAGTCHEALLQLNRQTDAVNQERARLREILKHTV